MAALDDLLQGWMYPTFLPNPFSVFVPSDGNALSPIIVPSSRPNPFMKSSRFLKSGRFPFHTFSHIGSHFSASMANGMPISAIPFVRPSKEKPCRRKRKRMKSKETRQNRSREPSKPYSTKNRVRSLLPRTKAFLQKSILPKRSSDESSFRTPPMEVFLPSFVPRRLLGQKSHFRNSNDGHRWNPEREEKSVPHQTLIERMQKKGRLFADYFPIRR